VRERVNDVESTAEIDGELFERFIFILQIHSIGIDRKNQCGRSDGGMLSVY